MKVLIATSTTDFDPTEVAVPWKILKAAGVDVRFATDTGLAGYADKRMLDGNKFYLLKPVLIADKSARVAYGEMRVDPAFKTPISYDEIKVTDYDGLLLPGGHSKGVIPYLESRDLQNAIVGFFSRDLPVGAICHGVVAACRAIDPATGKSVLYGRKTTALLKRQERLAYNLTRYNLGKYYLTYPETVEDEVTATLKSPADFLQGPLPMLRDSPNHMSRGFTVRDGNYLSARWPGDVYSFAAEFLKMLWA
ncbi:MAG: DJ-1/PfpI family protein [Rhodobacteraceae bacterium]|nr:DJ-1/PfpI family protein [Paracoccaceae bacterium]